jgi:hypothetical protein
MTFNFGLYLLFEDSYQWQSDIINGRLWRLAKTPPYKHGIIAYGEHNRRCSLGGWHKIRHVIASCAAKWWQFDNTYFCICSTNQ